MSLLRQFEVELLRAVANGNLPSFVEADNLQPNYGVMFLYAVSGRGIRVVITEKEESYE